MFTNKMDFSSCVIWIDFYKSSYILYTCVCMYVCVYKNHLAENTQILQDMEDLALILGRILQVLH